MMNVREYFDSLMSKMDLDEMFELEDQLLEMYYEDDGSFEEYMEAHNVDLSAKNEELGETYLTLWVWDMDGDC